jgi:hypothetical protein
MVFLPYCTGDVHTGNNVIVYKDPEGKEPDLEFHHNGHTNVIAATAWMDQQFQAIDRLFVTGCSAGGAGSIINYYFFRNRSNAQRGYLLDDSGPIFPSTGYSNPLHTMIRSSWDVDSIFTELPPGYEITDDFGKINTHVADLFPEDRLTTVYFQRDYNYSRYSYENFYEANAKSDIHEVLGRRHRAAGRPLPDPRQPRLLPALLARPQRQPLRVDRLVHRHRHRGARHQPRRLHRRAVQRRRPDRPLHARASSPTRTTSG